MCCSPMENPTFGLFVWVVVVGPVAVPVAVAVVTVAAAFFIILYFVVRKQKERKKEI